MKRHVTCFVEKAGFESRTLGTKAERYDHCATRLVLRNPKLNFPYVEWAEQLKAKETKKTVTLFDTVAKRKKKEKEEQQPAKDYARVE